MNDFIINVLPVQGPTIPMWFPFLGGFPINSPLIGSFLGVGLAFGSNWLANKRYQRGLKRYYLKLLNEETDQSKQKLSEALDSFGKIAIDINKFQQGEGFYPDPLPIDCWNSIISSGDLKLFDKEREASKLIKVYSKIQDYNYKLKRTIDAENESFLYSRGTMQMLALSMSANKKFCNEIKGLVNTGDALLIDLSQLKRGLDDGMTNHCPFRFDKK